jgi:hypothetical protein
VKARRIVAGAVTLALTWVFFWLVLAVVGALAGALPHNNAVTVTVAVVMGFPLTAALYLIVNRVVGPLWQWAAG